MNMSPAVASAFTCLLAACTVAVEPEHDTGSAREPWLSGAGPTRGHEDLTRFGVEMANDEIAADGGPSKFFPLVTEGEACATTAHDLLKGNCVTDWPDDEMTTYYGVSASEFGDAPELQDLHALRNFDGSKSPVSGRYGCHLIRARIQNATQRGLMFWQSADKAAAMRWIGHATHTVQDSFTPCHTTRSGAHFKTMVDICTYGVTFPGICTHHKPDTRDTVWRTSPLECLIGATRSWDCLVDEAQEASRATGGYLTVVARILNTGNYNGAQAAIETWFEGDPTVEHSGYFLCDALKSDGVEPDGWSPPGVDAGVADAPQEATLEAAADGPDGTSEAGHDVAAEEVGPDANGPEVSGPDVDAAADATIDAKPDAGGPGEPAPQAAEADGGCSCRTAGTRRGPGLGWGVAMLAIAGLVRRRRGGSPLATSWRSRRDPA